MSEQKVVLITGISGGLGQAMAKVFKEHGYFVAGTSRSQGDFEPDLFIMADLVDQNGAWQIMEELEKGAGRLDILINNAGIGVYDPWEVVEEKDLRYEMELNFFAAVRLTKAALPLLKRSRGRVINISSVAGKLPMPYMGAYSASKFALDAYSRSLRAELREDGIGVMTASPGRIQTGFGSHIIGGVKSPTTIGKASSEEFARKLYRAFVKEKEDWIFPGWYKFFLWFGRWFPKTYDKISVKTWKDAQ